MAPTLENDLRSAGFRGELLAEEPLAPYTTWRIGGPAELLASPADRDDLLAAVHWARTRGLAWRVLGNGSNVLVRDEGVRGLVVRMKRVLDHSRVEGTAVAAGAGASFPALANLAARHGLAGLEFAAGIPGTVGGAIVMNAGWHEFETGNLVSTVEVLDADRTVAVHDRERCKFGYRTSAFRGAGRVVLGAEFRLTPDEPRAIQARLDGFASTRKANQPTELPSCGSVFLKPEGDFAGRLIEAAGLRGRRIGDVQVSPKHANFFVNLGGGTAEDALALVELVEAEVFRASGVRLTREFEVW